MKLFPAFLRDFDAAAGFEWRERSYKLSKEIFCQILQENNARLEPRGG